MSKWDNCEKNNQADWFHAFGMPAYGNSISTIKISTLYRYPAFFGNYILVK
jgi:hypothetical protein